MIECEHCGEEFNSLGRHCAMSDCDYPELSDHQHGVVTGVLMGDGCVTQQGGKNPHLTVTNTNKEYLRYVSEQLGNLSRGVSLIASADEVRDVAERGDIIDVTEESEFSARYAVRSMSLPCLREYRGWYSSGKKVWPEDIVMTRTIFRHLYACDGHLNKRSGCLGITCNNERDRKESVEEMFYGAGFEPQHWNERDDSVTLMFGVEETKRLLDWSEPVPGFEYKWP